MDNIITSIHKHFDINSESLEILLKNLNLLNVRKKTKLIQPDRTDKNIYFVEKGIARAYTILDGKEVTSWFSEEGDLLYSTNSFHGPVPGYETETVQVLEDSVLYYMAIDQLEVLCRSHIDIANWMRYVHQRAFVQMERRLINRFYLSAEKRYEDFMVNHAKLIRRVNLGYIASYLGISHVTLCALRK
ncbi:MAG: cyclic nucleotide-binding protein [Sphingobacterium sp.]|jgi:CRP-like cAMP-binding protein|uniref:Crp/Fnr family transcriptional regulator n=1 Tax=unclassified Sphingobacterium TaxID=2609468 RepID=UPI0009863D4D|nr:Crp/Fnr family transcriptional regulator [Sphingobacterium sp. CZ-UAM]MDF2515143.1 cyclic nucleotide-binding protein [Sphingobacterium sp.]OOG19408.1 cyclic nucleotide-binding protein [Sphingobacterium sp. CZ-UAM]